MLETSESKESCLTTLRSCDSSGLVYCISRRCCPSIYIGETGRTLREHFGEHLRSIAKCVPSFPVAEHFNPHGHCLYDAQVCGVKLCGGTSKENDMRCVSFSNSKHGNRAASIPTSAFVDVSVRAPVITFKTQMSLWHGNIQLSFH